MLFLRILTGGFSRFITPQFYTSPLSDVQTFLFKTYDGHHPLQKFGESAVHLLHCSLGRLLKPAYNTTLCS